MAAISTPPNLQAAGSSQGLQKDEHNQLHLHNDLTQDSQIGTHHVNGYHARAEDPTRFDRSDRNPDSDASLSPRNPNKGDPNYLTPFKPGLRPELSRSHSGSEADSLIDLYGHPRSIAERSLDSGKPRSDSRDGNDPERRSSQDDGQEQSSWIHRDKLAKIERQEMRAAGITPPPVRESSRSRHRREKSRDQVVTDEPEITTEPESTLMGVKVSKRRKVKEAQREEAAEQEPEFNEFDIRTPEEIAEDARRERSPSPSPMYRQATARSSSSKIPVPRSSPMPLPQEHLERTTPLPRKRNASGTWSGMDEDGITYNRLRSRGNSAGSQAILDDIEGLPAPSTPITNSRPGSGNSPTKTRSGSMGKASHARKSSASTPSGAMPRSPTNPSSARSASGNIPQPKSRSGLEHRPPTAINRPEGEAPWLKDMYKPDPMLPPDQQMLPTHAKRLQEAQNRKEQWTQAEKDSAQRRQARGGDDDDVVTAFEGNSHIERDDLAGTGPSPLAVHTRNGLQPNTHDFRDDRGAGNRQTNPGAGTGGPEWPLAPDTSKTDRKMEPNGAEKTSPNAGYSAMPRIRPGPNEVGDGRATGLRQPKDSQQQQQQQPHGPVDPFDKERYARMNGDMEDGNSASAKDKKKGKGGCGCCVVM